MVISKIGHWYLEETRTYIGILESTGAPRLLPIHVPDKLMLGGIFYQTILQGFHSSLVKEKKRVFIPYGFYVGYNFVKDTTHARQEYQSQMEYSFLLGDTGNTTLGNWWLSMLIM
jgi:hypothetical protein